MTTRIGSARHILLLAGLSIALAPNAAPAPETVSEDACRVTEIARGHSWVSPYWGYNTPKIVFDGKTYYTVGLWGMKPESAEGAPLDSGERFGVAPGFLDVLSPASGSDLRQGIAVVGDGLMGNQATPEERVLWSVLPARAANNGLGLTPDCQD